MTGDDDLLERAARALRSEAPPSPEELAAGKRALLAAHRARSRPRGAVTRLRWLLPLAAVLAAGSALAHTTGQLERVTHAIAALLEPALEARRPTRAEKPRQAASRRPPPVAAPAPFPPPEPEPASAPPEPWAVPGAGASAEPPASERAAEPHRSPAPETRRESKRLHRPRRVEPTVAPRAPHPEPAEAEPLPLPSGDLARYREAHEAHFRARDFRAALRGWESYLAQYPDGTFAIEARYNRAICLVRLGRQEEARRALAPFARGEVGRGYRQLEARQLLEALE